MIIDQTLFPYVALGSGLLILVIWIIRLEIKVHRLLLGKDGKSLEDSILSARTALEKLEKFQREASAYFVDVERRLRKSIQSIETIRFNPFKGTGEGGNQSFSTAFMSEDGDGVVISSMYSRDHVSVFSKPVKKFQSEFDLTDEERGVMEEAKIRVAK